MLRFTNESRKIEWNQNKPKFWTNLITSALEGDNPDNPSALEREICPSASVLDKKCTTTHKRKKCQTQYNAKDIGALRNTLYKKDRKDHKMG